MYALLVFYVVIAFAAAAVLGMTFRARV